MYANEPGFAETTRHNRRLRSLEPADTPTGRESGLVETKINQRRHKGLRDPATARGVSNRTMISSIKEQGR